MFGLLQHNNIDPANYKRVRQNYCGTCKTIGKLYGQKERLFLNNDVVFLSELLAEINNGTDDFKAITVNTCFNLPKEKQEIPLFLQYAASVNVLLAYYKILDNIEDSKFRINVWQAIKSVESSSFDKAKRFLDDLKLDSDFISATIKKQFERERKKTTFSNIIDIAKYYSELTGQITGEVFKQGAVVINRQDLSNQLKSIGQNYGEIVYLVDAIEDYSKDTKKNNFNLFQLKSNKTKNSINDIEKQKVINYIHNNLSSIQNTISCLPIPSEKKVFFTNRLFEILNRISKKECSCKKEKCSIKKYIPIKDRFNYALSTSVALSQKNKNLILKTLSFIIVPLFLVTLFLLFPQIIHAQQKYHEPAHTCCGKCCGDCLGCDSCCRSCCGDGQYTRDGCGGGRCGSEQGDKFSETFCFWPGCLGCCGIPLIGLCCSGCSSGDGPKVITITKIIPVDRGCGGCK